MIKTVDPAAGLNWLQGGWSAFRAGGAVLIAMVLVTLLAVFVLRWVPLLGALLAPVAGTLLYAGMLKGLRKHAGGGELRFDDLYSALTDQDKAVHLLIIAVVPVVGAVLSALFGGGFFGWVLGSLVMLCVAALTYFAVPLVLFRQMEAPQALAMSVRGVLQNLPAVLVYWMVCVLLIGLAVLPLGLGLLVLGPVLLGAAYEAYAEIYGDIEIVPNGPPPPPQAEGGSAD
ncbi:MAG: hypothetical protein U1F26_01970 [Lysobacterales bacterium]